MMPAMEVEDPEVAEEVAEVTLPVEAEDSEPASGEPLLGLEDALSRIPKALRKQMEDQLRAEFREVRRWSPGQN